MTKKKKKRQLLFMIDYDLYPVQTLVAIGAASEDVMKFIESQKYDLCDEERKVLSRMRGMGKTVMLADNSKTVMMIQEFPHDPKSHAVISHEAFHVAENIAYHIGLKLCDHSSEAFSYLLEHVVRRTYYEIAKE